MGMGQQIRDRERAAIIGALGAGVVPSVGLQHIQVGRRAEVEAMIADLRKIEDGGAAIRYIVGRFGSGKSFFLSLIQAVALERKLVIARADITTDRRLNGTGGTARAFYAELMKSLATRTRPDGSAMGSILERWIVDVSEPVKSAGGSEDAVQAGIKQELRPLEEMVGGYEFSAVVGSYYRGFATHDQDLQAAALRWLRGEYSSKTDARRDLGVRGIVDDDSIYDFLKLVARFITIAGYRGLLVCVDELVVLSHRLNNRVARDRNYEALLRILNDCLQGSAAGIGFVFAATDECLSDTRRGLFSYEALATRLAPNRFASDRLADLSGPVIQLPNLTPEDCFVLLHNIRRVYCRGEGEDRLLPEEGIVAYLESCNRRVGAAYYLTPRETIKDFVGLLSVLEQHPDVGWRAALTGLAPSVASTEPPSTPESDGDDLVSMKA